MRDTNSAFAVLVVLLLLIVVDIIWKELPKQGQSALEMAGHKLLRWRRENPIVSLECNPAPEENQRLNAILDWLDRPEANLRNRG